MTYIERIKRNEIKGPKERKRELSLSASFIFVSMDHDATSFLSPVICLLPFQTSNRSKREIPRKIQERIDTESTPEARETGET